MDIDDFLELATIIRRKEVNTYSALIMADEKDRDYYKREMRIYDLFEQIVNCYLMAREKRWVLLH